MTRLRAGFSLLEIVVAITLLGLVAVSVAGYQGVTARNLALSNQLSFATLVAREATDSLRALPFDSVAVGQTVRARTISKYTFTVTQTIALSTPALKTVLVSVANSQGREIQQFNSAIYASKPR